MKSFKMASLLWSNYFKIFFYMDYKGRWSLILLPKLFDMLTRSEVWHNIKGSRITVKSQTLKILLANKLWSWWVCYHLRTVIRNPRKNAWVKVFRFHTYEKLSQRSFFEVYTLWGRLLVIGFQFHSKNSTAVVDFRQIYNTYTL